MGANLSVTVEPDLSGVTWSPGDRNAFIMLGIIWALVFYACAMIYTTCALIDRWKGPGDKIRTGRSSVFAALMLSTGWPVVMAYMMVSM